MKPRPLSQRDYRNRVKQCYPRAVCQTLKREGVSGEVIWYQVVLEPGNRFPVPFAVERSPLAAWKVAWERISKQRGAK